MAAKFQQRKGIKAEENGQEVEDQRDKMKKKEPNK